MIKASLVAMMVLTFLIATGLRWREDRLATSRPTPRLDIITRGKRTVNRWVTAAAIAAGATMIVLGGIHWLRLAIG
ncbi:MULTISPECIES: hypothetical protein [Neoroseomonas]|uniref:Uncharacterized protein n=2 Tax=Neoroseomonas TaxID=2870716 RepID=A0A9X9WMY3_9PROT|nr:MULTISPECIES: hypothetical protein [Neoroseomonas]MBR0661693.1 hypothetical protein [Neoroseomonas oryzicola]NKE20090.1 hypothetical protein [Neoroseomonas oryzicola]NMJ44248.1 hypothetical protein [Neoroseomonas marina]